MACTDPHTNQDVRMRKHFYCALMGGGKKRENNYRSVLQKIDVKETGACL